MASYEPEYSLQVYQSDDTTPWGDPWTSRAGGTRPYLDAPSVRRTPGIVDLVRGIGEASSVSFRMLDKKTGSGNADRELSALLGDSEGNPQWNGLRAVLKWRENDSANWRTVKDGRIANLETDENKVTWSFEILDDRIALLARIFTGARFSWEYFQRWDAGDAPSYAAPGSLYPAGPLVDYPFDGDATPGASGTMTASGIDPDEDEDTRAAFEALHEQAQAVRQIGDTEVVRDLMVRVERVSDQSVRYYFLHADQNPDLTSRNRQDDTGERVGLVLVKGEGDEAQALFADGTVVRFWVVPYGEPSEHAPFHWRAHPATSTKHALEGQFGPFKTDAGSIVPARAIRHDAARLDALAGDGSWHEKRDRVQSTWKLQEYLRNAIFAADGWAPSVDDQGRIYILTHRPPTSLAGLVTLDETNVKPVSEGPPWRNPGVEGLAKVVFDAFVERREFGRPQTSSPDRIREYEAPYTALSADTFGRISEREVRLPARASRGTISVQRFFDSYANFLRRQYAHGPQFVAVRGRWADVADLKVGDHVIGEVPWVPDPVSNRRGGTRVYQILQRDPDGPWVRLDLIDIGTNAFADQPTASAIAKDGGAPHDAVDVALSVKADTLAEVWTAETDASVSARPADDDDAWRPKAQSDAVSSDTALTLTARGHDAGKRVWVRYRAFSSGPDRLVSGWRYPTDDGLAADYVDLDDRPEITRASANPVRSGGGVELEVETNGAGDGVRVEYGLTDAHGSQVDLDTSSGKASTTIAFTTGELAFLRLTAYPNYPVSGSAGEVVNLTSRILPPALIAAIRNFRLLEYTADWRKYGWDLQEDVEAVYIYDIRVEQPVDTPPWPDKETMPTVVLEPDDPQEYTVSIPTPGFVRYLHVEGRGDGLDASEAIQLEISSQLPDPDRIIELTARLNVADGSGQIRIKTPARAKSYRLAYTVAATPTPPTDMEVEAATPRTLTDGEDTIALAADTVPFFEMIWIRACAYLGADGTGEGGATDHGDFARAIGVRIARPEDFVTISTAEPSGTPKTGVGSLWLQVE